MSSSKSATKTNVCPFCQEEILPKAIKCKHCGSLVSKARPLKVHILSGHDTTANFEIYVNTWIEERHNKLDIHDIKISYAIDPTSIWSPSQFFTVMIIYS